MLRGTYRGVQYIAHTLVQVDLLVFVGDKEHGVDVDDEIQNFQLHCWVHNCVLHFPVPELQ